MFTQTFSGRIWDHSYIFQVEDILKCSAAQTHWICVAKTGLLEQVCFEAEKNLPLIAVIAENVQPA